jgi:hypothetical protein
VSQSAASIAAGPARTAQPLLEVIAFRRFTDGIAGRCEIAPQIAEADQIGSYRLFGN